jgi:hypothetical protein
LAVSFDETVFEHLVEADAGYPTQVVAAVRSTRSTWPHLTEG